MPVTITCALSGPDKVRLRLQVCDRAFRLTPCQLAELAAIIQDGVTRERVALRRTGEGIDSVTARRFRKLAKEMERAAWNV